MECEIPKSERIELTENYNYANLIINEDSNINNIIDINKKISNNTKTNVTMYTKISRNINHYSCSINDKNK